MARLRVNLAVLYLCNLALVTIAYSLRCGVHEETKSLEELHAEALSEGAKLVIYHGGDTPDRQDFVVNAFREAYPDINLTMVVDYSKYHNARIDNQLDTNTLVPDI
ncbi:hypothetical protein FOL47_004485, partial [Perkinsus chesapeaki]